MIRQLAIPAKFVKNRDITGLTNLFRDQPLTGAQARELRGTVFIAFPELEVEGVEIYDNPSVRSYLRSAHDAIPHLFYFLTPERMAGSIDGFIWGNMSSAEYAGRDPAIPIPQHVVDKLTEHLIYAAVYANEKGDDWRVVHNALLASVPAASRKPLMSLIEGAMREFAASG